MLTAAVMIIPAAVFASAAPSAYRSLVADGSLVLLYTFASGEKGVPNPADSGRDALGYVNCSAYGVWRGLEVWPDDLVPED